MLRGMLQCCTGTLQEHIVMISNTDHTLNKLMCLYLLGDWLDTINIYNHNFYILFYVFNLCTHVYCCVDSMWTVCSLLSVLC